MEQQEKQESCLIAEMAASLTGSGVSKSGSPAARAITSCPLSFMLLAKSVSAIVLAIGMLFTLGLISVSCATLVAPLLLTIVPALKISLLMTWSKVMSSKYQLEFKHEVRAEMRLVAGLSFPLLHFLLFSYVHLPDSTYQHIGSVLIRMSLSNTLPVKQA